MTKEEHDRMVAQAEANAKIIAKKRKKEELKQKVDDARKKVKVDKKDYLVDKAFLGTTLTCAAGGAVSTVLGTVMSYVASPTYVMAAVGGAMIAGIMGFFTNMMAEMTGSSKRMLKESQKKLADAEKAEREELERQASEENQKEEKEEEMEV